MKPRHFIAASIRLRLAGALLLTACLPVARAADTPTAAPCNPLLETVRRIATDRVSETLPDLRRDYDLLAELRYVTQFSQVASEYDPRFQTRIYYAATAQADARGRIPRVDPEAKALYVFFHGSGTAKASGGNFSNKMNDLANMGYSSIGFDLPFHGAGPYSEKFDDPAVVTKWIDDILRAHRQPGQPVYLVGHSFGPDLIAEYVYRNPFAVDGVVAISPAGYRPELQHWITTRTDKMKFGGEVPPNTPGGEYAARFSERAGWTKVTAGSPQDPTVRNPRLKFQVLIGERDEYFPAPLGKGPSKTPVGPMTYDACGEYRKIFGRVDCRLEPGIGHYIFLHQDASGANVVNREILRVDGKTPADGEAFRTSTTKGVTTPSKALARRYRQDRFFRQWVDERLPGEKLTRFLARREDVAANGLLKQYDALFARRMERLNQNIRDTVQWAPEFYARNRGTIDKLGQPKVDPNNLYNRYFELLESLPPERRPVVAEL